MHPPYPPPHPPAHRPPQGYLVQRIIACENRRLPCLCAEWCFDGCTAGCIRQVSACGAPNWTIENGCLLRITIPVSVCLCDACGRSFSRAASIEAETDLPRTFPCSLSDPCTTLFLLPCIHLNHADCSCGGCFRVQLTVSLDLYLLRYETLHCGSPKPPCPQLPLYPPPRC